MNLWSAFAAAVMWALAAPVVSAGVSRLPEERRAEALVQGLFVAVLTGSVVLAPIAMRSIAHVDLNIFVVLAGVMTFAVATLLYYLTAYAFTSRAELASQFARVKPAFSILLAVLVLHEVLTFPTVLAAVLVFIGLLLFGVGAARGHFTWQSVWFGLATAAAWAIGEMLVGIGFPRGGGIVPTWIGLVSALILMLPFAVVATWRRHLVKQDRAWLVFFAGHGALSFAVAYTLYFYSIASNGLTPTVLVTAFWPALALGIAWLGARLRGRPYKVPTLMWIAAALLLVGSLVQSLMKG